MTSTGEQRFAAAIFDMDGLLLDSERIIAAAWLEAARRCHVALTQNDFIQVIGLAVDDSNTLLTSLLGGRRQFEQIRDVAVDLLHNGKPTIDYPAKADAIRFVSAVRERGIPCAVASSTELSEIKRRLQVVDLLALFDHVSSAQEVARGKPDPAVYLLAAQRLGIAPDRCLAFEDSDNGIRAALAAGIAVVTVPDLKRPESSLLAQVEFCAASLSACSDKLDHWFGIT